MYHYSARKTSLITKLWAAKRRELYNTVRKNKFAQNQEYTRGPIKTYLQVTLKELLPCILKNIITVSSNDQTPYTADSNEVAFNSRTVKISLMTFLNTVSELLHFLHSQSRVEILLKLKIAERNYCRSLSSSPCFCQNAATCLVYLNIDVFSHWFWSIVLNLFYP